LPTNTPTPTPSICGDGSLDPGEECDDANAVDGDCCSANCKLDPVGTVCDDGLTCTIGDQCDGFGVCRGTPSVGDYAILRWSATDPLGSTAVTLGDRTLLKGHVCTDTIRQRNRSRVIGDVVGLVEAGGTAIKFAKRTRVAGAVITAGGNITGLAKVQIAANRVDTDGVAPELDDCTTARVRATEKQAVLTALPASPGLAFGVVKVKGKKPLAIPAAGDLGPGQVVIGISGDLKIGNYGRLTINGASTTTEVIVHILGNLSMRGKAKIELHGLDPRQVIFVVDGQVKAGGDTRIPGTILGAGKIALFGRNTTDGAVLGRISIKTRSYVVINRRAWVGWCD